MQAMPTTSTEPRSSDDHCCCRHWPFADNDPGELWLPAARALDSFAPFGGDEGRWQARFRLEAPPDDPSGAWYLTVQGGHGPVADFVASGAVRFETFVVIDTHDVAVDDERFRVVLLRNSRRTITDHISTGGGTDSSPETTPEPVDREFTVEVDLAERGVAALWSVAAGVVDDVIDLGLDGAEPLASLAPRTMAFALRSRAGSADSTSDKWLAGGTIRVDSYSAASGVRYSGKGVRDGSNWVNEGAETAGNSEAWIWRDPASKANPVGYTVSGASIRRP